MRRENSGANVLVSIRQTAWDRICERVIKDMERGGLPGGRGLMAKVKEMVGKTCNEAVRDQGLFRENIEKGESSDV